MYSAAMCVCISFSDCVVTILVFICALATCTVLE